MLLAAACAVLGACAPTPPGPTAIGPDQRFSGLVNGSHDGAVITTVCAGPGWPGRTGHPVGGQTVSVVRDPTGAGDTGDYSSVFAQTSTAFDVVAFDTYGTDRELPTTLDVPCDGTGTVTFLQCFGIIACRNGRPDVVKVTFLNIAD
jgi:hypothetical protein